MAYSKHHRALCGPFKTPQGAMWCFILGFNIENWMARWLANISQLFSEIIWFFQFFTPQSALWPIQNTAKRFVAYSKHYKALCGLFRQYTTKCFVVVIVIIAILSVEVILCGQNWQRGSLILTGRLARFSHHPLHYLCMQFFDWLVLFTIAVLSIMW